MNKSDIMLLNKAFLVSENSLEDIKVGCIIVDNNDVIVGKGYNWCSSRLIFKEKKERTHYIIHAEHSAIFNCVKNGNANRMYKMIVTAFPCHDCARMIVSSGICKLVVGYTKEIEENPKWNKHFETTKKYFYTHGIEIINS